jgi:hypothetical protein
VPGLPPCTSVPSVVNRLYAAAVAYLSGWLSNVSLHSSEQKWNFRPPYSEWKLVCFSSISILQTGSVVMSILLIVQFQSRMHEPHTGLLLIETLMEHVRDGHEFHSCRLELQIDCGFSR